MDEKQMANTILALLNRWTARKESDAFATILPPFVKVICGDAWDDLAKACRAAASDGKLPADEEITLTKLSIEIDAAIQTRRGPRRFWKFLGLG
jgi:hypothetical protein